MMLYISHVKLADYISRRHSQAEKSLIATSCVLNFHPHDLGRVCLFQGENCELRQCATERTYALCHLGIKGEGHRMARNEKPSGKGKIKFRFIDFEMDGGDATLQDAIREITRAIGKPQIAKSSLALIGTSGSATPPSHVTDEIEDDEQAVDDAATDDAVNDADRSTADPKPRRFKSPTIVEVDFKGDNPLRPFLESLPLDSDAKKYLAIAYWFKTHRATPEVTPDHIYTAYKAMSWTNIPKDVAQPLRALKFKGSFAKGSGKQGYLLNHIGEDKVQQMLNKTQP